MAKGNAILRWLQAVLLLPFVVLVVVPSLILLAVHGSMTASSTGEWYFWVGLVISVPGLTLAGWNVWLFIRFGNGTAAPWDPPQNLVVRGPYRHVRNPMITGVVFLLLAECLIFGSWAIAVWFGIFTIGNMVYLPMFEEPGLIKRFGDDYLEYRKHVPRWIPRITPWTLPPTNSDT
ncbi:MAG: isoprenylcysteine carboxylmethyltransferase family protein [Phycisphaeraceae bacterium]